MKIILLSIWAFISGSIMYSYILPLLIKGIDVRSAYEDHNPGASNARRSCGWPVGILCAALDVSKAFIPVFVALNIYEAIGFELIPIAVAPVLGHAYSPWLRGRGGKAIATAFGSMLGMIEICAAFPIMAISTVICVITIKNRPMAMCGACILTASLCLIRGIAAPYRIAATLICAVVFMKHRPEASAYLRERFCG